MVFLQQLVPVNLSAIDRSLKPPLIVGLELFAELNLLAEDRVDAVVHREELALKNLLSLLSSTSPSVVPRECNPVKQPYIQLSKIRMCFCYRLLLNLSTADLRAHSSACYQLRN